MNTQATSSSETLLHFTIDVFMSLEETILIAKGYKRRLLKWNMKIGCQCKNWVRLSRWILVVNLQIEGSP